jgi:membrane protease YdiL (CAAX protease family)
MPELSASKRFLLMAVAFEGGLGVVAIVLGLLFGPPPGARLIPDGLLSLGTAAALLIGIAAAVPMLVLLVLLDHFPLGPLHRLQALVETHLAPLFAPLSTLELLLVSIAAGWGEELLFRGWLQAGLTQWIGPPLGIGVGLVLASIAFGACHWLSNTYAVLAALVGLYMGWLFLATDSLLAPMATHAAYDFVALMYLVKWKGRAQNRRLNADNRQPATNDHE